MQHVTWKQEQQNPKKTLYWQACATRHPTHKTYAKLKMWKEKVNELGTKHSLQRFQIYLKNKETKCSVIQVKKNLWIVQSRQIDDIKQFCFILSTQFNVWTCVSWIQQKWRINYKYYKLKCWIRWIVVEIPTPSPKYQFTSKEGGNTGPIASRARSSFLPFWWSNGKPSTGIDL